MMLRIFGAVLLWLVAMPGCAGFSRSSDLDFPADVLAYQSKHNIVFRGPISCFEARVVDDLLSVLPRQVAATVKSVSVNDYPQHYANPVSAAHCHSTGDVCSKSVFLDNPAVLWHEAAHAYHFTLSEKFDADWSKVAGKVYDEDKASQSANFNPNDGLLNEYSRNNLSEDAAEFTAEFYMSVTDRPSQFSDLRGKPVSKDPRYRKKIDLLLKYGFIMKSDYEKFIKKFSFLSKDS